MAPAAGPEMSGQAKAMRPEDVTRLVAERLNAGDAAGVAALYEPQAVLAYRADRPVTGREAIQAIYQQMVDAGVQFALETPLPTVRFEDLALTSTRSADNTGVRSRCCAASLMARGCGSSTGPRCPSHSPPGGSPVPDAGRGSLPRRGLPRRRMGTPA